MAAVVSYALDDGTVMRFEIEPSAGFRSAGPNTPARLEHSAS